MPLTDRDRKLLATLSSYLAHLRLRSALDPAAIEPFGAEDAAVQRWLQLSIQCCLDLGDSALGHLNRAEPGRYRDIFSALHREGIIQAPLARTMERLAGFRNVLVHGYADLTPQQTWRELRRALPALEEFAENISRQ